MKRRHNFLTGAAVLASGVAIVKIIGFLGKVPLINILGGSGYGHYNVAYSIYNFMLIISTAGLPVAISKLVAEANARGRTREIKTIVRTAMSIFLLVGVTLSAGAFLFAEQLAGMMKSPDSVYTIRAIAPAIFFMTVMSSLRGYYQGLSNMYPTSISQIIEALGKVILGLAIAGYLSGQGYSYDIIAAGAVFGMTLGTVIAMLFLVVRKALDRDPPRGPVTESRTVKDIAKSILAIAIPVTVGSGTLALTNMIDSMLVMNRLQSAAGFTKDEAVWLFGAYGIAQTMFNFPSSFIVPFAISVVPSVAAAILALPAAAGLSVLSWPILNLLFKASPDEVNAAATPLAILAIAVFFNCVVLVSNAVLQSIGKARVPVYNMVAGSVVKIITNWILVGIPEININGAPIGTCLCYLVIMVLNLVSIAREVKPAPNFLRVFGRPLIATVIMAAAAWAINGLASARLPADPAVLIAIAAACIIYLILVVVMRLLTREDLLLLPKGEKIARIFRIS
jgi:stage V sporulation protein B